MQTYSKKILLCLSLLVLHLPLFSQNAEIDSLEHLLANHQKTDTVKIDLLNDIAFKVRFYNLNRSLQYALIADSLSDIMAYKKGKAKSLKIRGVYFKIVEDYPKALDCYQRSIKISQDINDEETMAACYNNIGNIYRGQGNYPLAMENYQKTLSLFEKLGNKHHAAVCQLNIAGLYGFIGKKDEELPLYLKAADYFSEIQDYRNLILVYQNIINVYRITGYDSLAISYINRLIPLCTTMNDNEKLALAHLHYGLIEEKLGNFNSAEQKLFKTISISEKHNFKRAMISGYHSIARLYYKQGDYDLALKFALKANHTDRLEDKSKAAELLSFIYDKTNNYKEAYKYHVIFKNISDSIYNESNIKEITTLENQYKFEKEKETIAIEQAKKDTIQQTEMDYQKTLRNYFIMAFIFMIVFSIIIFRNLANIRKANKKLEHQKKEIEAQKEEIQTQADKIAEQYEDLEKLDHFKETLTHTLIHDLKNPLSQILTNTKNQRVDHAARKMLQLITNLLDVEKYENTSFKLNKEWFPLRKILKEVQKGQQSSLKEKNLTMNLSFCNCRVLADKGTIVRVMDNLLSNAIRFSPQNRSIDVSAKKGSDKHVMIAIKNYGPLIVLEDLPFIFDRYRHFENSNSNSHLSTGLGLTFCKMAIEAHGHAISAKNDEDGVVFSFSLNGEIENEYSRSEEDHGNDLVLKADDMAIAKPFFDQLRKIEVSQVSDILEVLGNIPEETENISLLKQQIRDAVFASNKELYQRIILGKKAGLA